MTTINKSFSLAMLAVLLAHTSCLAAGWSFQLNNSFNFTKANLTVEHLDRCRYEGTAATTDWTSSRNFTTFLLSPELIWQSPDYPVYALATGSYGWLFDGQLKNDPLKWDVDGTEKSFTLEFGGVVNVCQRFTFLPHLGFYWDLVDTRLKKQRETRPNPTCYISNNGNRSSTLFYVPYMGFEIDFTTELWNCRKVQISTLYDIGYWGSGHIRNTVPSTVITNTPANSRYGSHVTYSNMFYQNWLVALVTDFSKQWRGAIEFNYYTFYNTHKLPVKLKHNRAIVESGQFTRTQYHVASEAYIRTISLVFVLNYSFGGSEGAFIR
jgi:hypothetical protein